MDKSGMKNFSHAAVALCALCLLPGCQTINDWFEEPIIQNPQGWVPQLPFETPSPLIGTRPITKGDVIGVIIYVNGLEVMKTGGRVDETGNVMLLLIGDLFVENQKPSEAAVTIAKAYSDKNVYINPVANVVLGETPPPTPIFMRGNINRVGSQPFYESLTLLQAIIAAGDVNYGAGKYVEIFRNGASMKYNLRNIKSGKDPDPILRPNDIITVPEKGFWEW